MAAIPLSRTSHEFPSFWSADVDPAVPSHRLSCMRSPSTMTLLALALALLGAGCVLILLERAASMEWGSVAGAAALLLALLFAAWAVAARLAMRRNDRALGHAPELSTLVFPPSSFK